MERLVAAASPGPIAGVALDLGVSSLQLDGAERGFSFRLDGPLDMRMGEKGESAADLVARLGEDELERLIRGLGEERFARRVARAIVAARRRAPIRRTGELAEIVRAASRRANPGLIRQRAHFRRCVLQSTTNWANWSADWRAPNGC